MRRRHRTASIWIAIAAGLTACGSSSDDSATVATISTSTTAVSATTAATMSPPTTTVAPSPSTTKPLVTTTAAPPEAPSMRGGRYCEVLLVRPIDDVPSAEVYNSYPLNACPPDVWNSLDAAAIASANGAPLAVLNGPRFWLMDSVETVDTEAPPPVDFGGISMTLRATVDLGSVGAGDPPYTEHRVNRRATFRFDSGSTVYELVASDGSIYVMQSWSGQVDPTLDEASLDALGERLALPDGWAFQTRTLTEPLQVVTTDTDAVVLQDELRNSYSKRA